MIFSKPNAGKIIGALSNICTLFNMGCQEMSLKAGFFRLKLYTGKMVIWTFFNAF